MSHRYTSTAIIADLVIVLLVAFTSGCTKLHEEQYNVINTGIFPKTDDDALSLLVASAYYPFLSDSYSGLFNVAQTGIGTISEFTTDIGNCQWDAAVWDPLLNFDFKANLTSTSAPYTDHINDLSSMTMTIDRLEKMNLPDDLKSSLIAQVNLGRGWLTYLLYDLYGSIQIATAEELSAVEDKVLPRKTKEETVAFIKETISGAIPYLPDHLHPSDADYGTYTKALGYTILMKLAMHEGEWSEAVKYGRELTSSKYGFDLMPEYKDIFTLENEGNKEIIWSAVCSTSGAHQLWLAHVLPSNYPTKNPNIQKWNGYRVNWAFYNTFDPEDKRLECLVGEYTGTDGVVYNEANPGTNLIKGALPVKYGEDPAATGEESQIDWVIYRYADILTLLSEAIVRDGNVVTNEAVSLLNRVRTRAGLDAYNSSDFTGVDDFLDAILEERGHELWFENNRRTDLIRHGKYIEYARKYMNAVTPEDYMTLMPIPQSIIDEGKGLVLQNPGY